MNLYCELKRKAQEFPSATAFIEKDNCYSYETLIKDIDTISSSLSYLGINPKDHIGMLCLNQLEYVQLLFATNKIGAAAVPINCMQPESVIEYIINDSNLKLLFISIELVPVIRNILPVILEKGIKVIIIGEKLPDFSNIMTFSEFAGLSSEPTDTFVEENNTAVILYTSGTTGLPKGVMLTNENLISNVEGFCATNKLPVGAKSILALPLFHSFGQIVLLVCLFNHITTIFINQFLPTTILKVLCSHQAQVLPLVPTMFDVILNASVAKNIPLDHIKYCITGGAPIPYALIQKLKTNTNACIIEGYGLTETSPVITISHSHKCYKNGSVGKPIPCVTVKIADDGEILVKGNSVTKGYWNKPEENETAFSIDGYFKTGDVGYIDEEGFLFITDRKKDLIIRAGENISPKQIENVLFNADGVNDVAVFGVKDEKLGEVVYCAIESEQDIDINYLKEYCKRDLPKHLIPEKFVIMPKLPKNALGKILKYKLKEMFV